MLLLISDDPADAGPSPAQLSSRRAVALLRAGVPLTLLMDLACPFGPASAEFYAQEVAC